MMRISSDGGMPELLQEPDADEGELSYSFPDILPSGEAVVFGVQTARGDELAVKSLQTGEQQSLSIMGGKPRFAGSGHLIYQSQNSRSRDGTSRRSGPQMASGLLLGQG
jgi:hypothetical protein